MSTVPAKPAQRRRTGSAASRKSAQATKDAAKRQEEPQAEPQSEADRLAAKYGEMDKGAKDEAARLAEKYSEPEQPAVEAAAPERPRADVERECRQKYGEAHDEHMRMNNECPWCALAGPAGPVEPEHVGCLESDPTVELGAPDEIRPPDFSAKPADAWAELEVEVVMVPMYRPKITVVTPQPDTERLVEVTTCEHTVWGHESEKAARKCMTRWVNQRGLRYSTTN